MNSAASNPKRKTLLVRCAIAACATLVILWMLFPNNQYDQIKEAVKQAPSEAASISDIPKSPSQPIEQPVEHPVEQGGLFLELNIHTTMICLACSLSLIILRFADNTVETIDPRLTSTHCSQPHPGKPLIQYAIMIDAGSSGSRIHVYRFNYCKADPELEHEQFVAIKPGLSSYKNDPVAAAKSLDQLMDEALKTVPTELHHCTPVAVKATAGLRLIGQEKADAILKAVQDRIENKYPFPVVAKDGVVLMDGRDEGVYAWITVNYLLGNLKGSRHETAAIFDLGGGSTQIVFEPKFIDTDQLAEGEHKYQLTFAGQNYDLYQHSYLGYGLNSARDTILAEMIKEWNGQKSVQHPCLPKNRSEKYVKEDTGEEHDLVGTGAGYSQCRAVVEKMMNKDAKCSLAPCSFSGVYQPSLQDTFASHDLYAFSYFYDVTQPLGMPLEFSVGSVREMAENICAENYSLIEHVPGAVKEVQSNPTYCLELTYLHELLKSGYGLPEDRMVKTAKKINDAETGWSLGASIAVLDEAQLCRIK
ncbi:hypothetical protein INT43_001682 [Umbelopsis isabellina]|uniref:guanosine-diphosphatase n=1 Tax=Mortierella isabellina TaxID=91625 RepID=A0A8H7UAX7_MORIS|nr:hypothetical protein INT43_001682 [Umbelopsis isabellina]